MKKLLLIVLLSLFALPAFAKDVYVNGYTRKDGTYVQPHHRSAPDNNYYNNYGSQGNTNPYTGKDGTVTYDQYQQKKANSGYNNGYNNPYGN